MHGKTWKHKLRNEYIREYVVIMQIKDKVMKI